MLIKFTLILCLFLGLSGFFVACSSDEDNKKTHYERGLNYADQEKYQEAVIEFRSVIQLDPNHADAKYQLGLIYLKQGEAVKLKKAFKMFSEAVEAKPELMDAHLRLGMFYLMAKDFPHAREKAELILKKDAKSQDALRIRARVDVGEKQFAAAEAGFRQLIALYPIFLSSYFELSDLLVVQKKLAAAETVLVKALLQDEKNKSTHLGLARLYGLKGENKKAEKYYKKLLELAPKEKGFQFVLAQFYLKTGQLEHAEQSFLAVTELNSKDHEPLLWLGDFYVTQKILDKAESSFRKAKVIETDGQESQKRLAKLMLLRGDVDAFRVTVSEILAAAPKDIDAMYFKGRLALSEGQSAEAAVLFREVAQSQRHALESNYYLGLAHLQARELQQAKSAWVTALKYDDQHAPSLIALSELYLRSKSFDLVVETLVPVLKQSEVDMRALLLMGDASVGLRQPEEAEGFYKRAVAQAPKRYLPRFRMGLLLASQKHYKKATVFFEQALEADPSQAGALRRIVAIRLAQGDVSGAIKRVNRHILAQPTLGVFRRIRGVLYRSGDRPQKAIVDFKKALELDPMDLEAYLDLGRLYGAQQEYEKALTELDQAILTDPKSLQAPMLKGVIFEAQGQFEAAQAAYEQVLDLNPRFAPAANNLAWIYSEHGGNIDKALSLAQLAKEQFPENPGVTDTLGWIYYKKNVFLKAMSLLEESADKLPQNPIVRYHLGMAYAKAGKKKEAKIELEAAIALNSDFPGLDNATQVLSELLSDGDG